MSGNFMYAYECECGHLIKKRGTDWTNEEPHGMPVIILDTFMQETFNCDKCGKAWGTGDESMFVEEF